MNKRVNYAALGPKQILALFPEAVAFLNDTGELRDDLYEALYEHYTGTGEMPYGTAKARDGDPMNWVYAKVEELLTP